MLIDPKLKSQVDALWDKSWSGGLTNPLDAIEFRASSGCKGEASAAHTGLLTRGSLADASP